jgi:hypothetical protein
MTTPSGNSSGSFRGSDKPFPAFPPFPEGESGKGEGIPDFPDATGKKEKGIGKNLILALDPGPTQTGWAAFEDGQVLASGVHENPEVLRMLESWHASGAQLAVEMIASYGMAVGREVFETCVWIGRFMQAWPDPTSVRRILRQTVKLHLCQSVRAKDTNVWQALVDKLGPPGTKREPGPLFGVRSHARAALAVAVTASETTS